MERIFLIPLDRTRATIQISSNEFSLGRALTNSYVIKEICISRFHCVFKFANGNWTITDSSANGTTVNEIPIDRNVGYQLKNNDVIALTTALRYIFRVVTTASIAKRQRIDTDCDENQLVECRIEVQNEASASQELRNELLRERGLIKRLKVEAQDMQDKVLGLNVDLFNKTVTNVNLEQEVFDLKIYCATLEKEKEELQMQICDLESESTSLKKHVENCEHENTTKPQQEKLAEDIEKDLYYCTLRAEIADKEIVLKSKLQKTLLDFNQLKINAHSKKAAVIVKTAIEELQNDVEEVVAKRKELEHNMAGGDNSENSEVIMSLIENEFQCSICSELFIKATTLNCSHTFCKKCISQWKVQKNTCPVCRLTIITAAPCIVLDNYIDQFVNTLSPSKKEIRSKLKETHEAYESSSVEIDNGSNNEGSSSTRTLYVTLHDTSSEENSDTDYDFTDYSDSEPFYGGYGRCYICGQAGHWANTCPRRRQRF